MKNEGKKWTLEDEDYLKNNYPKYGAEYCANVLLRYKKAIIKRANILNIKFEKVRFKYLQENLEPIVKESFNVSEVIKKMGLRAAGGNHKVVSDYIKKYNLDISHFIQDNGIGLLNLKNAREKNTIPLVDILKENSNYSRTSLKRRLYENKLKEHKCELCGQGEEWKGKHMSLILDHKNGIYNDNRLENLRIVCPNCNATLDTHCGKQRKKVDGRNRPGVERRKANRPPLEQLKKEIQELGYSATGRKYGVSDNAIRKWVKSYEKYNI